MNRGRNSRFFSRGLFIFCVSVYNKGCKFDICVEFYEMTAVFGDGKGLPMEPRIELLPGVCLRAIHTDRFKTGCMNINFVRPLTAQEAPMAALAPSVLLRGTRRHPDIRSISAFLDEHYGASVGALTRKKGEILTTGFFADFPEEALLPAGEKVFNPVVDFLGELLFDPRLADGSFLPDVFEGEKRNLLDTIDWRLNDKRTYSVYRMIKNMCKDEAYGVPRLGERPEAEAITRDALLAWYRRMLRHSRIELFYMGARSRDEVAEALKAILSPLERGELDPVGTEVIRSAGPLRQVEDRLDVLQGKLCIGLRTGITGDDPDYPALMMLNAVFGAGTTSKLFLNVREKLSLCYYASSSIDRFKGLMIVSSGIETSNFERTKAEIFRQLDACIRGDISEEELENARRAILSALRASLDSPSRMDEYSLGCALAGHDVSIESLMASIRAVTKDEVCAAAKKLSVDTIYFLKGATQ